MHFDFLRTHMNYECAILKLLSIPIGFFALLSSRNIHFMHSTAHAITTLCANESLLNITNMLCYAMQVLRFLYLMSSHLMCPFSSPYYISSRHYGFDRLLSYLFIPKLLLNRTVLTIRVASIHGIPPIPRLYGICINSPHALYLLTKLTKNL